MLHETGHQVGHLTGWNAELAAALGQRLAVRSRELAETWQGWASEVAADVHAFAQAGWAPVAALANVVDGPSAAVYRIRYGDPHPFPFVRVLFNVALCRSWYGAGPWDIIAAAWSQRHHPETVGGDAGALTRASLDAFDDIVEVCTRQPMAAFGGSPLAAVLDPRRVSPAALDSLARQAGPSLLTSSYLRRREPLRILALLATRAVLDPERAGEHRARLLAWVSDLGADGVAAPPIRSRAASEAPEKGSAMTEPEFSTGTGSSAGRLPPPSARRVDTAAHQAAVSVEKSRRPRGQPPGHSTSRRDGRSQPRGTEGAVRLRVSWRAARPARDRLQSTSR